MRAALDAILIAMFLALAIITASSWGNRSIAAQDALRHLSAICRTSLSVREVLTEEGGAVLIECEPDEEQAAPKKGRGGVAM